MKLIYFVIVVLIVYIIASNITVVHLNSLPDEQKTELNNRSKIRSMLVSNHIKENEHVDINDKKLLSLTSEYPNDGEVVLPNSNNVIFFIKTNFTEPIQFTENNNSEYITNISPSNLNNYTKKINLNISKWNSLFIKQFNINKALIVLEKIKIIYIINSGNESLLTLFMSLTYLNKLIHVKVSYYFTNKNELSDFKLTAIESISKQEFDDFVSTNSTDNGTGSFTLHSNLSKQSFSAQQPSNDIEPFALNDNYFEYN